MFNGRSWKKSKHDARVQAIFSSFPALLGTPYELEPYPEDWYVELVAEHEARVASGYYHSPEFRAPDDTDDTEGK